MLKRALVHLLQGALLIGGCKLGDPPRPEGVPPGPVTGQPGADAAGDAPRTPNATLVVQVLDAKTNQPVPKTLIVVDIAGKHERGAIAVADGIARIPIPIVPTLKVRTYFEGYVSTETELDLTRPDVIRDPEPGIFVVRANPLSSAQALGVPTILAFEAKGSDGGVSDEVPAGSSFEIEATLAAAAPNADAGSDASADASADAASASDPLSKDVLVIQPNGFVVTALTPPAAGSDGIYKGSVPMPVIPGTFNYYLVLRTEGSVSSATKVVSVTGRSTQPNFLFRGRAVDEDGGAPLPDTLVTVEMGEAYVKYADTSRASPYYQYGGITDDAGYFSIPVPRERIGIHTFADGYQYGGFLKTKERTIPAGDAGVDDAGNLDFDAGIDDAGYLIFDHRLTSGPLLPARPTATGFTATPSTVARGGKITFTATLAKGGNDALSDEIIIVQPDTHVARMMSAPSPGVLSQGFPDGLYTLDLRAPPAQGTYQYYLVYTSEGCVVGDKKVLSITVTP